MKRRKSILRIVACTLSILLITEGISGVPGIVFAADMDMAGETVARTDTDEAVAETDTDEAAARIGTDEEAARTGTDEETARTDTDEEVDETDTDEEVDETDTDEEAVRTDTVEEISSNGTVGDDAELTDINEKIPKLNPLSALPEDGGDHVTGANTVIDKIGMDGYDPVTDDGMELYTAFEADLNLEIQGGRYFKGHEIINFGAGNSGSSVVFALDEIPVEMSDNYMLFVDYYDYSGNPDGDLVYYLERVTGTALYAWEYEKQTDGTYKRVRSVPIEDFTINDDDDTMYVNLGLGYIDEEKRNFDDLQNLGTYTAPKIYSYLSDHPGMKKDHYQHVPTLSGLVRLNGQAFKNPSKNPIAIAAMCYDATATAEEDLYKTESGTAAGYTWTYHEYSWDNNAGFVATQSISYDCYYYGGDDNYTKYWSDEPYYASNMGSFSLRPYVYRFTDTGNEHILTLYHVTPYSLFARKIQEGRHCFDNWKASDYSQANLPIDTWKIPATYTDPLSGTVYNVRIAKGGNIVPHYASKLIIENGVGFPDDCSYLFSSAARINVDMRCLSEIVIQGNPKTVGSNITNMSYMFLGKQGREGFDATTYKTLDFAAFDTSNVTDMSYLFADVTMTNRANIDVTTLDTSNVTSFKGMFRSYHVPSGLYQPATALDLSHFNTESAVDMSEMFEGSSVSALDLSCFDFSNVTDMSGMFTFTEYLESITFPSDMDSSKVTDMSFMFAGDYNLTQIGNITAMDTDSVTDMSGMFGAHTCRIKNYETIPVDLDSEVWSGSYQYDKHLNGFAVFNPAWVTAEVFNVNDGPAITSLDLTGFDTRKVKYANGMFYMPNLTEIKWGTNTTFESLSDAGGMFTLASVEKLDLTGRKFSNIKFACSDRFPIEMFNLNTATELVLGEDSINLSDLSSKGQLMINAPELYSLDLRAVEMGANALVGEGVLNYGSPGSLQGLSGLYELYLPAGMPALASPAELPGTFYDDDGEAYTVINGGYENDLHLVNPEKEITEIIPLERVSLDQNSMTLNVGETETLTARREPANATCKTFSWESSDPAVATVDGSGLVTAVGPGTAVITATATDESGKYARCTITVYRAVEVTFDANAGGDAVTLTPASKTVICGEEYGELPVPVRTYHDFDGWYLRETTGDVKVTARTVMTAEDDHVLYAGWIPYNGWKKEGDIWKYFDNARYLTNTFLQLGASSYYLTGDGSRAIGRRQITVTIPADSTDWYYFNRKGVMQTGWVSDGAGKHYYDPDGGAMVTSSWIGEGKGRIYVDGQGERISAGPVQIDGLEYYFDNNGQVRTGWIKITDHWYYYNPSEDNYGARITAPDDDNAGTNNTMRIIIAGKTYLIDETGERLTGWTDPYDYIDEAGDPQSGFLCYYDTNGTLVTGWKKIDGDWYYFWPNDTTDSSDPTAGHARGTKAVGMAVVDGKLYQFGPDGVRAGAGVDAGAGGSSGSIGTTGRNGVVKVEEAGFITTSDGTEVYVNESGKIAKNVWIQETVSVSDGNGGKVQENRDVRIGADGRRESGVTKVDGRLYAFTNGVKDTSSDEYTYNPDGSIRTGWFEKDGRSHYCDDAGNVLKETTCRIGNKVYGFDADGGLMAEGMYSHIPVAGENPEDYAVDSPGTARYKVKDDGTLYTGWDGDYYFSTTTGEKCTGLGKVGTKWYYFDASGAVQKTTGFVTTDGVTNKYYINDRGTVQTGWKTVTTENPGAGEQTEVRYYFDKTGLRKDGVITVGIRRYYQTAKGIITSGTADGTSGTITFTAKCRDAGGVTVFDVRDTQFPDVPHIIAVTSTGALKSGWLTVTDPGTGTESTYYFDTTTGAAYTGYHAIGGRWYFFGPDGRLE